MFLGEIAATTIYTTYPPTATTQTIREKDFTGNSMVNDVGIYGLFGSLPHCPARITSSESSYISIYMYRMCVIPVRLTARFALFYCIYRYACIRAEKLHDGDLVTLVLVQNNAVYYKILFLYNSHSKSFFVFLNNIFLFLSKHNWQNIINVLRVYFLCFI